MNGGLNSKYKAEIPNFSSVERTGPELLTVLVFLQLCGVVLRSQSKKTSSRKKKINKNYVLSKYEEGTMTKKTHGSNFNIENRYVQAFILQTFIKL